jgi:hypothetical protein
MKEWRVNAIVTTLYYIGIYRHTELITHVHAFTKNGAKRKALRKFKKLLKPKKVEIIRIRQIKQGD